MSNVPADLKYTKSHEWVRTLADGTLEIGITDHAQQALGDLVFVEVPEAGRAVKADEPCAVVESVKAASDVYAPLAGEVTAGNPKLADAPETVNTAPYGAGWLLRLKPKPGAVAAAGLMSAADYQKLLDAEGG
jgi:glycine cleavage system H protein